MEARIVDNVTRDMASVLSATIEHSTDVRIAVAFVSKRGLGMIWQPMETVLQMGAYLEFLVGLDMRTTEPDALQDLYNLCRINNNISLYCYSRVNPAGIYHPKLYLLKGGDDGVTSIVGSSNLTVGGLKKNTEINVVVTGSIRDEVISDSYAIYNRLKFHENRVEPDDEYLVLYKELRSQEKKLQNRTSRDGSVRELTTKFNEKAKSLRSPKPTRRDIIGGWLEMVYDSLPAGEFTNEQIYAYEKLFHQQYPENRNVRAKIRQQLQILRDIGVVEHLGASHWRKA